MSQKREAVFEVERAVEVELVLPEGRADFLPGEPGRVGVEVRGERAEEFEIQQSGHRISLRVPRGFSYRWSDFEVTVRLPPDYLAALSFQVASASVNVEAGLGSLWGALASGDLLAQEVAGEASVRSASGDVELGRVGGEVKINTASGDIRLGEGGGETHLNSASGDVSVGSALAGLAVRTASGDFAVESYAGGDLRANTVSGEVRVSLPAGRELEVDLNSLSGEIRSDFQPDPSAEKRPEQAGAARLRVRTISGDITLGSARVVA